MIFVSMRLALILWCSTTYNHRHKQDLNESMKLMRATYISHVKANNLVWIFFRELIQSFQLLSSTYILQMIKVKQHGKFLYERNHTYWILFINLNKNVSIRMIKFSEHTSFNF